MGFRAYLASSLWDYLLCVLAATGLAYTVFSGFYATQPFQAYPWAIALACAGSIAVLFCVAYNVRAAVIGGVGLAVALAAAVVLLQGSNPGAHPVDDVEGNYTLAVLGLAAVSAGVFLVSRRYGGCLALVVVGALVCALIEYLYWYGHVAAALAFLVGALALAAFRRYQRGLAGSDTETLAFASVALAAVALCAVAVGVAYGIYVLAVQPLDPPGVQVKLIVEHRRAEEIEIVGAGAMAADQAGGQDDQAEDDQDDASRDKPQDSLQDRLMSALGLAGEETNEDPATALERVVRWALACVAGLIAALVLAVVVRKLLRARRYRKLVDAPNEAAVRNLYEFFVERFWKMKIPHPDHLTPGEYYADFKATFDQFERFAAPGGTDFGDVSRLFVQAAYGCEPMQDEQVAALKGYYGVFYKNARRYVGPLRYLAKFFVL